MPKNMCLDLPEELLEFLSGLAADAHKSEQEIIIEAIKKYRSAHKLREMREWFATTCGQLADLFREEAPKKKTAIMMGNINVGEDRLTLAIRLPSSIFHASQLLLSYFSDSDKFRASIGYQVDRDDAEEVVERLSNSGLDYMMFYPGCELDIYCEEKVSFKTKNDFDPNQFF